MTMRAIFLVLFCAPLLVQPFALSPLNGLTQRAALRTPQGIRGACRLGLRMDGSDEGGSTASDQALWASLRKRMGPVPDADLSGDALGCLPTADKMSHTDVVTVALRALMTMDEPWEGHGTEILIAYTSDQAKEENPAIYSCPESLAKALMMNPDTRMAMDVQDFKLEDERWLNQNTLVLIKTSILLTSGEWTTLCFSLSRSGNRWMIDEMGRAAV
eukprot:CAMPEP_0173392880 /NCGR_PEP_ID=MMETSP1356-20130122/21577_1 /TAXON_ID=77927 ORGANISM="Hemiselmis virescens, Strain PCC157" /NCGR_SAMPLE_ID=MMETSP1356 /ASSEMBLY_ACC=CAM_ASM_000847 /LENGTH=215 /DNA_ID=CAMNT_0014350803 /DNA_START=18 /DNA_END=665 /DNA_ORIENTATION=+